MDARPHQPPGTVRPRRYLPKFHYELLVCGLLGHTLIGTDAARLRPEDAVFAREIGGVRWYRCVRCDSWLPLPTPVNFPRQHPPERDEIELPLRGKALRDKIVLRLIAIDRAFHFVLLGLLAAAIFLFASRKVELRDTFYRVIADIQRGFGGAPVQTERTGVLHELDKLFSLREGTLDLVGAAVAVYAVVEGLEAVGLWFQRRWAEYLTFLATTALLPLEIYELTRRLSPLKISAIVINIAVVVYLLRAKRLFGIRGGAAAERAERERDIGWEALERTAPEHGGVPSAAHG
ncbi:MAG: hypothetical protein QOK04_1926 [Solirubrobacteraceae bacterium]|nr:hypothetical protein [Solirubrobacteraceae bacterium]